ncbi:CDP-glycerol glycerophosphotransferase family protein [Streptomyces sp. NPDC050738]|uniref:bifunctional glycosyltransferase/CDP-glycerol:glycerophosphate glycerophosphotransferase n=1 Tax=Streptomyces sp. NPDC050738 TaxID=3154744 RepID=UPI0034175D31
MPRFSVVMPVHRVQGYLRAAVESVLAQSYGDFELIVVEDHSPDGCAAIAEEYADRDPRVTLLPLASHQGVGAARNAGAGLARGDHLLFLDGDDLLLPGALEAIAGRLTETGHPDVLLFGHDRIDWWETVTPGGDDLTDPLSATPVPWNRVFGRAFFTGHRLGFRYGPYGHLLPVHRATRLLDGPPAVLDRNCVRHRIRRGGSTSSTPGRQHFTLFDAYTAVLADSGPHPCLFGPMTDHTLAVLDDPGRIAPEDRKAFFQRAAEHYRIHVPEGYDPPPHHRPLATGSYAAHQALGAAADRRTRARSAVLTYKKHLRTRAMRTAYSADLRTSRLDPNLAVYGAYWNRGVSCNPAAIAARARELVPHIRQVWAVSSRHADRLPPGTEHVIEGSRAYWRAMARATYLINNSSFPGGFTKRPGQVYLQTHHGTPLKSMGLDQRRYPASGGSTDFAKILAHTDQWDFSLSSNPHSTEVWDRVYPSAAYEHLDLGYPRNDTYFTTTPAEIAALRTGLGIERGQTALLYAPTHRDYERGFVPHLDLERVSRELTEEYVLLVRAHYFYGAQPGVSGARVIDVSSHPSTEELALASDALITDYSSLMFDYACLDRPIITYAPDWPAYRASRGTYFDLLSGEPGETPGAVATTEDELLDLLDSVSWDTEATTALRAAFRARFCPYDDGGAAERVVRRLFMAS